MATNDKHEEIPREGSGDDALWRLLGRASRPRPVSPYFARRVLREVAALGETRHARWNWVSWLWRSGRWTPGVAFAGVLMVAGIAVGGMIFSLKHGQSTAGTATRVAVSRSEPALAPAAALADNVLPATMPEIDPVPQPTVAMASEPVVTAQDVEVIADLDNVLSREESRLWTEDDTARF